MILIAGLGNPGNQYNLTRHNFGFNIVDSIKTTLNFPPFIDRFNSLYSRKVVFNENVIILKPMSFMNLSGESLKKIYNFFKLSTTKDVIVFHDDLDLEFPKIRIKTTGGHGGHNGIRNIINLIGPNFYRIKFGIKNKKYVDEKIPADNFVLSKFETEELEKIEIIKNKILNNFELIVKKEFLSFSENF
jgi:PTH1 family peptidyl-tRNA hydrolase|tara:strand:+ start:1634 stop:2197 length:564 start_codon:yes stop_codon:yes gene_type:complete